MIIAWGDNGDGWVVEHCIVFHMGELHKALPKMIHVICELKAFIERRRVEELNHLIQGEGVKRTNRHQKRALEVDSRGVLGCAENFLLVQPSQRRAYFNESAIGCQMKMSSRISSSEYREQ
jgi:hypothetical protein